MMIPAVAQLTVSEWLSRGQVVALLTVVILPAAGLLWLRVRQREDGGRRVFAGYLLALLGVFWAHELAGIRAGTPTAAAWRGWLSDFVQLPYAWLYLRFVRRYFGVERWAPGWSAWLGGLEKAYLVPLGLIAVDMVTGWGVASWVILLLNLTNLMGSYVLAVWAWRRGVGGAGNFVAGVLPMALAGLLLAVQWVVEPGGSSINGMFPFWLGIVLHVLVFWVVLERSDRASAGPPPTETP